MLWDTAVDPLGLKATTHLGQRWFVLFEYRITRFAGQNDYNVTAITIVGNELFDPWQTW